MTRKNILLVAVLVFIAGSIFYLQSQKAGNSGLVTRKELVPETQQPGVPSSTTSTTVSAVSPRTAIIKEKARKYSPAVELAGPTGFINTDSFNLASLIGKKIILIDFWTYSCINCIRTLPYLNSWYEKYKDKGFVIIGVHTPEFEFEKKYENVQGAVKRFGIKYPVVLDSDHATWSAYGNQYWPAEYLIDIDGFVVHHAIGEGHYDETEREIQKALAERMAAVGEAGTIASDISNPKGVVDVNGSELGSPEVYFGAARNEYLGNGIRGAAGTQTLEDPKEIKLNALYLTGTWNFTDQFAENANAGAKIIFRYKAKSVYIVGSARNPVTLTVLRDGKTLGTEAGEDVTLGKVTAQEDRLYKLIDDPVGYGEHTIEIIIDKPGLKAFTFTFG